MNPLQLGQQQSGQMVTMPSISTSEYGLCSEQCCLNHITTISGRLHHKYYSMYAALSNRQTGKTREVAKAHVDPMAGLFDGKPIPPLYACVQVQELLKTSYEDNEIDIPTSDGRTTL